MLRESLNIVYRGDFSEAEEINHNYRKRIHTGAMDSSFTIK
jgi:hypothetical protein